MTLHAVALRVATGAALEPLSCRLAVLEKPERLRIVKGDVATAGRRRAVRLVAILAEHLGVVAARAVALTPVRLGRVPDDEVRWMESALALAAMAIAAELPGVTPLAGELPAGGRGPVCGQESPRMHAHRHRFYRRGRRGRRGNFNSRSFWKSFWQSTFLCALCALCGNKAFCFLPAGACVATELDLEGGHRPRTSGVVSAVAAAISSHRAIRSGDGRGSVLGIAAAQLDS